MKKLLMILSILMLVLALMAACGSSDKTTSETTAQTTAPETSAATTTSGASVETTVADTTTAPVTTAWQTTPATTAPATTAIVTTAPETSAPSTEVTTEEVPTVIPAPAAVSYNYFLSGFKYSTLNEKGQTVKHEIYKTNTMQMASDPTAFYYEYDESGKLIGYRSCIYGEITEGVVTLEDNGQTATIVNPATGEAIIRLLFDENGVLGTEYWLENDKPIFIFEYDENGRLYEETIPNDDFQMTVVTVYEENTANVLFEVLGTKVTDILIEYNEAGYPVTLQNRSESSDDFYSYEYDKWNRCVTAISVEDGYEDIRYYTYDTLSRVVKTVIESDDGISEYTYRYNEQNLKIRMEYIFKTYNDVVEDCYVSVYEYDEKGRRIKAIDYEGGDETSHYSKWIYESVYDENGVLIEEHAAYKTADDGFIAQFKDTYEYDSKGREVKWSIMEYDENGKVINTRVEETVYAENGSVAQEITSYYDANGNLKDQTIKDYTE